MTNERTDHVAEAWELIQAERKPSVAGWETADAQHLANLMEAQALASLALVEQQRIGNLIALAGIPGLNGFENEVYDVRLEALMSGLLDRREVPAVPGYGPAGIDEQTFIRPEIAAALGIQEVQS